MLKLFEHPFSPYVQKVKIALYEKNVPFEVEVPDAFSGAPTQFASTNPRIEVPALVDDDFAIFDSTVILDYIEEKWPAPALLLSTPRERARVRMIEDVCDTYYEAINWGLMEIRAWKRVSGEPAKQLEQKASEQTAGVFAWLERELGAANYFNGESFGYGDLSVYPHVHGSVVWGNAPKAGTRLAGWLARVEERQSVRKTIEAAQQFAGSMDSLPVLLESGAFTRQYRDHRLEWMIRSGGVEVVLAGMKKKTIRFSAEVS
jgi:glutathione S-transferase